MGAPALALAQAGKDEVDAAKNALDLRIYQATADALVAQREAETRKATAEAERAVRRCRPRQGVRPGPATGCGRVRRAARRPIYGHLRTRLHARRGRRTYRQRRHLAPDGRPPKAKQGAAALYRDPHAVRNEDQLRPVGGADRGTATVKAMADITSLFKTDVTAAGIGYGEGARSLFVTSLSHACPAKVAGLGSGYLGELDSVQYDKLLAKVRTLASQRGIYANRIAIAQKLADAAKADQKKDLAAVANAAGALLKTVDTFVESLKAGEVSDKSPLFNAARYLGYAARTNGALVLDFDLRLEGMTIVKDNLFTGQHLRLSGVAFNLVSVA